MNTLVQISRAAIQHEEEETATFGVDDAASLPISLRLILLSFCLPEGMSFFVAGLRLTVARAIFLFLAPVLFMKLGQRVAAGRYLFVHSDLFVPLACLCMFIGPTITDSFGDALAHSGPVVLEFLIAYMATRLLLTRDGQARAFAGFLCLVICFVVFDAFLDTLTGRYFTRDLVSQITGFEKIWRVNDEIRFGLLRAAGPLEHPIILGFTSAIGLLIASAVNIALRPFCIVVCALGVVIAFSSAPEQSAIIGFGLLTYGTATTRMAGRWIMIVGLAAICIAAVFLTVNAPFGHIIDVMTLDPSTGYYRLYIWNTVGPLILENPYFGVAQGLIEQVYEGSIDSLWLVLSLLYGIPCAVFTGLAMIGACSRPTSGPRAVLTIDEMRLGRILGIVIFLVMFAAFTVHFWGSIWVLVALLVGLRAHLGELAALNAADRTIWRDSVAATVAADGLAGPGS